MDFDAACLALTFMRQQPVAKPPRNWSPKISPWIVRLLRPPRLRRQRKQGLVEIDIRGLENLTQAMQAGHGVLITPNHPHPSDPLSMYSVADATGGPFYFMAAWQTFGRASWLASRVLRWHGCFSVDREGTDLAAVKQSISILADGRFPLVIFPEGEIYHTNDLVTPFREGPATIALSAARRADRPISIVPAAIKYHYLTDPTEALSAAMDRLERVINWRPKRDLPLTERIYRYAEVILAIKDFEYTGEAGRGELTERIAVLREHVLSRLENEYGLTAGELNVPERIKSVRQSILKRREDLAEGDAQREQCDQHFDDVFLAVQLLAYPGDYVKTSPTIERIAETVDKFEEDVLFHRDLTERGKRRATISLGKPIEAPSERSRGAGTELTMSLETAVQTMLDDIEPPPRSWR